MQVILITDSTTEVFDGCSSSDFVSQVKEKFPFEFHFEVDGVIVSELALFSNHSSDFLIVHLKESNGLVGGKGGFGAQLRSLAKQKGAKKTTNFGACRDLSGRRLRHINDEIILSKWKSSKDRGTDFDIEQETQTGINLWFLSAPSWADGIKIDKRKKFLKTHAKTAMCIDWLRAREGGKLSPKGANNHWGCPRGATCDFAHGEADLRNATSGNSGTTQEIQPASKRERYVQSYLDQIKDDDEIQDMIQTGLLHAKKRPKLTHEDPTTTPLVVSSELTTLSTDLTLSSSTTIPTHVPVSKKLQELVSQEKLAQSCGIQILTGSMIIEQVPTQGIVLIGNSLFTTSVYTLATIPTLPPSAATSAEIVQDMSSHTKKDCWYYEIELLSDGLMQLGWVSNSFTVPATSSSNAPPSSTSSSSAPVEDIDDVVITTAIASNGVGDDASSWAYDGYRQKVFHASQETVYGPQTGQIWKYGDVIGCYLSITTTTAAAHVTAAEDIAKIPSSQQVEIGFTVNGVDYGIAYSFPFLPSDEFYPGISLENDESVLLNMGGKEFRYPYPTSTMPTTATGTATGTADTVTVLKGASEETSTTWHRIASLDQSPETGTSSSSVIETYEDVIDVLSSAYDTVEAVEGLGLNRLKYELLQRKLKIGGTIQERAKRLFDWRTQQIQLANNSATKGSKKGKKDKKKSTSEEA